MSDNEGNIFFVAFSANGSINSSNPFNVLFSFTAAKNESAPEFFITRIISSMLLFSATSLATFCIVFSWKPAPFRSDSILDFSAVRTAFIVFPIIFLDRPEPSMISLIIIDVFIVAGEEIIFGSIPIPKLPFLGDVNVVHASIRTASDASESL